MTIYSKATKLSNKARSSNPSGAIVNYISTDVPRVKNLAAKGHLLWSIPLQICMALYSLYQLLGASAFIVFVTVIGVVFLYMFVSK
jgi:hypothetical protein